MSASNSTVTDNDMVATSSEPDPSAEPPISANLEPADLGGEQSETRDVPQDPLSERDAEKTTQDPDAQDPEAQDPEAQDPETEGPAATQDTPASEETPSADEDQDFDKVTPADSPSHFAQQVRIKREESHVSIIFPPEETNANPDVAVDFIDSQIWLDLQQRLSGGTAFSSETPVHLYTQNSLWDTRQLQELDEALGRFNLTLARVITSRRQTAVAAAMSGYSTDQVNHVPELLGKTSDRSDSPTLAEPLYLQKTIRSGTEIRHPGSVIIVGDLNPGSSIIAEGDILIWGRLRGIAHAGAGGNKQSTIMALKLEAPQLRIAGAVARVAAQSNDSSTTPEIAYVTPKGIRITAAYSFNRHDLPPVTSN